MRRALFLSVTGMVMAFGCSDANPLPPSTGMQYVLQANRTLDTAIRVGDPSQTLSEADYVPTQTVVDYEVSFANDGRRVSITGSNSAGEVDELVGEMAEVHGGRWIYDLGEGTFAGGRFVVWEGDGTLEAELTFFGSGVALIGSVRGPLRPAGSP